MSGHSGFQPIGNSLPPIIPQPQVGDVRGPGQAPQSQPPAVSGGDVPAQDYKVREDAAKALTRKLDTMLLQAAKLSTLTVDNASLKSAMDAAHLGKADRKDLADAAKKAQKAMKAVSEFSGRQIAAALVAGKDGFLDWKKGSSAAKAIVAAIDAQAELSIRLTDLANSLADSPDVADGDAFDALSELALQCDRRQSEIFNLAMELADVVADSGDDPRLDAKLAALLPGQAVSMHGNLDVIDKLKAQLQPLADRLEAFAARPAASITSAEFTAYAAEVKNASAAISRALKEGFPAPGGGRFRPDRAFMASLAELARFAEGKLENVRKTVGEARLRDFANRVIGLPESVPIFDPENLAGLNQYAPALVKIVKLRRQLRDACLQYVDNPTKEMEAKIEGLFSAYSSIDTDGLKDKVDYLRSHLKGMSTADWEEATRFLRPKLRTLRTQIAHFGQMVRRVNARLTPEQFLSTDSARALLEGRLDFSTLVEARIHGMSDADVDPALDDSRLASSETLGSGNSSTVSLVTYRDGSQYVFKPEASGRQMMEGFKLSKDYRPEQQVAQLNLATQSVASALGLGDAVPRCTVGAHKGDYGLFMEKVPGQDGTDFVKKAPSAPDCLGASEIRRLPPEQYGKVLGGILRGLNRLEWLDRITGQGDRHSHNYLIEVRKDLTVSVKGIDNDQSFPAYRTGLTTFVLDAKNAASFKKHCKEVVDKCPKRLQAAVRARIEGDPGVTRNPDGTITLDTSKFQAGELFYAAKTTIGMHGCTLPDFIDEDLYAQLLDLKAGEKREALLADLARRLPAAALDSARKRLDEAIAHAEKLAGEGKVVRNEDFSQRDVQKRLLQRELDAPSNPIKPVNGKSPFSSESEIVAQAARQPRSLFFRDLFNSLERKGWFR